MEEKTASPVNSVEIEELESRDAPAKFFEPPDPC
jgi:hypothetical protein